MKLKIGLIIFVSLVLVQVVVYGFMVRDTIETVETENQWLAREIRSQETQSAQLRREIKRLELMIAAIPPSFLAGFEDPEAEFMEFLNYINDPLLEESDVQISMRRAPTFTGQPIPHHESQFSLSFSFVDTREAENLLNFIMHQELFPVKLSGMSLRGTGSQEVTADMNLSLHIPARLTQPLAAVERETR